MIKAKAETKKGPLAIIGLSAGNIKNLQLGKPIRVNLAELGLSGYVMIFAGETEASMARELAEFIDEKTEIHGLDKISS